MNLVEFESNKKFAFNDYIFQRFTFFEKSEEYADITAQFLRTFFKFLKLKIALKIIFISKTTFRNEPQIHFTKHFCSEKWIRGL